jgi:predicted homoserine dehydrogenase-like protein
MVVISISLFMPNLNLNRVQKQQFSQESKMNLFTKLKQRGEEGNPIKVGLIGGGKFGTMFLSQVLRLPGIHVVGIADLSPAAVRSNLEFLG